MPINFLLLYERKTDFLRKSAHFIVYDGEGGFRKYEEPSLEQNIDSLSFVTQNRTAQLMWDTGEQIDADELKKLQLLKDASSTVIVINTNLEAISAQVTALNSDVTLLDSSPTQATVLAVLKRIVDRQIIIFNSLEKSLKREKQLISIVENLVKRAL